MDKSQLGDCSQPVLAGRNIHFELADRTIRLCLGAGFRRVLLRGDTDFTQTQHLDRWDDDPRVRFIFGVDCHATLHRLADELPETAWKPLKRSPKYRVKTKPRARPARVKQQIVDERGYRDIHLESEEVAEFDYRPTACQRISSPNLKGACGPYTRR